MDRKKRIHGLISKIADELFQFIKEEGPSFKDGWVPSIKIKESLELNFLCVPKHNKQYGEKGWFLAILARMLEDEERIEHRKFGNRAFFRII